MNTNNAALVATLYADSYDDIGTRIWFQKYNEKFTELIVLECAELCSTLDGGENMFSRGIRKHFGVEE